MKDIIKIGCPKCGSVLTVKNQIGIESKNVTCPICKTTYPFLSFKAMDSMDDDEPTQYPDLERDTNPKENLSMGRIKVPNTSLSFQLMSGKNIIGRKARESKAHFQIPCQNKRMSREHLVIEVSKVHGKGFVHYASLYKKLVNPTYIGETLLEYGDKFILNHGDIIRLPDVDIHFEIPDDDRTEL